MWPSDKGLQHFMTADENDLNFEFRSSCIVNEINCFKQIFASDMQSCGQKWNSPSPCSALEGIPLKTQEEPGDTRGSQWPVGNVVWKS